MDKQELDEIREEYANTIVDLSVSSSAIIDKLIAEVERLQAEKTIILDYWHHISTTLANGREAAIADMKAMVSTYAVQHEDSQPELDPCQYCKNSSKRACDSCTVIFGLEGASKSYFEWRGLQDG